jgi:hypothetical protein
MKWNTLVALVVSGAVLGYGGINLHAETIKITAERSPQQVFRAIVPPPKEALTLVSVSLVTVAGEVVGGLAEYDDALTTRPADYLELFNNMGALLAVGWFDRFGIERVVVDRALVEEADTLEGVFVQLLTGDAI